MLKAFRTRATLRRKAGEIYGLIVTQARQPAFYAALGVPDTPEGRYNVVVLHLFLVLERLRTVAATQALQQALIEAFVSDMDDSMRELGTGDVVVGKKVRKAASGFYERSRGYREALASEDAAGLAEALMRWMAPEADAQKGGALAAYVRAGAAALDGQSISDIGDGQLVFPLVARFAGEGA